MPEEGRLAVIIVNFNGERFLRPCLDALRSQSFDDFFTVVLDNGSADSSVGIITRDYPDITLMRSDVNLGFAAGNNIAIRACLDRGPDYVLTLNNDVILEPDCVERLVSLLDSGPDTWCCQPKMYLEGTGGPPVFNNAGIVVWRDGSAYNRGINEPDEGQYDASADVFGVCAGCGLYRASVLRRTGLFDEDFFAYMEDVDLAWRGRLLGYSAALCPTAVCHHHHGGAATGSGRKITLVEANRIRILCKEYSLLDIAMSPLFTAYRLACLAALFRSPRARGGRRVEAYSAGLSPAGIMVSMLKGWALGIMAAPSSFAGRRRFRREMAPPGNARMILKRYSAPLRPLIGK